MYYIALRVWRQKLQSIACDDIPAEFGQKQPEICGVFVAAVFATLMLVPLRLCCD